MIKISDAYKEFVKSNIRPKCEPIIKVSGKDNNGNDIELVWRGKDIKDLTYKRSIDPVGRELPYMELTWTEIYTGKLNAESYPEKYNNITKYMQVELSFVQDLGFYNTWKTIFNGGINWCDLFSKKATWKQVKNEVLQETVTLPKLFLNAKPTINGQTITWTAKDSLSFANESCLTDYSSNIKIQNIMANLVLNLRGAFLNSRSLFYAYTNTATKILLDEKVEYLKRGIICDGQIKNVVVNLASIYNRYFDFEDDVFVLKSFSPNSVSEQDVVFDFDKKILYSYPNIKATPNVSSYLFKHRTVERKEEEWYYKSPDRSLGDFENESLVEYFFDGYVHALKTYDGEPDFVTRVNFGSLNKGYDVTDERMNNKTYVIPLKYNAYDNIMDNGNVGEPFVEDNPINPYSSEDPQMKSRRDFITNYFLNSSTLSFEALPNLAVQTGDIIKVDTNLYNENGKEIKKIAIVVSVELKYNGSIKQTIKAHEVSI